MPSLIARGLVSMIMGYILNTDYQGKMESTYLGKGVFLLASYVT